VDPGHSAIERPETILRNAAELFRVLAKSPQEGSALASEYLHARKHVTPAEKAQISALAFSALRNKTLVEHCAGEALQRSAPELLPDMGLELRWRMIAALAFEQDAPIDGSRERTAPLAPPARESDGGLLERLANILALQPGERDHAILQGVVRSIRQCREDAEAELTATTSGCGMKKVTRYCSMPEWILDAWAARMPPHSAASLACAFMRDASAVIRVNLSKCTREEAIALLGAEGITTSLAPLSPGGLVLCKRHALAGSEVYRKGWIEVQDEGSQLIACALAPDPSWSILDACAGAGGKALHLADLQGDAGTIEARDVDARKLRVLQQRARRCGLHSISAAPAGLKQAGNNSRSSARGARSARLFDAVLVDAPCSGIGTARRAPMMKWRLTPRALDRVSTAQRNILASAAATLRPGGVLVYSTCSLMHEENDGVIEWFLDAHPGFKPEPLRDAFLKYDIRIQGLGADDATVTLRPDIHSTDGFFIARLRRTW
jgi:16S rRNA (cytosine967-C5)-methyltransferase